MHTTPLRQLTGDQCSVELCCVVGLVCVGFVGLRERDPLNHRGRVCYPWGRSKGVTGFETGVAFHVAWEGYAVFLGVRG